MWINYVYTGFGFLNLLIYYMLKSTYTTFAEYVIFPIAIVLLFMGIIRPNIYMNNGSELK